MDYERNDGQIVVRLDPGDHVLNKLSELRDKEDLTGAFFTGIGAVDTVTLGHYNVETEAYTEKTFEGQFEVSQFTGNIGPDKIHAHITIGDHEYESLAGHCSRAVVSGTFEIIIWPTATELDHRPDDTTGLDVFDL